MQLLQNTRIWIILALLLSPTALVAQDNAAASDSEAAEEPAAEAEAEPAADPAPEAAPADQQPVDITVTEHGDWELRCEGPENCFMYQLTRDADLNPVAEISIVNLPAGGDAVAGVTVVTPLGTLLSEGVLMQVDSGRARKYEFGWCTRAGCFSRFGLTADDLANMRAGNVAKLRIVAVTTPDRPVVLDVSLKGFTAAFNELTNG